MNSCKSMKKQATTKSSHEVMSPRKDFPGRQRRNCPPIPLMTKGKVKMEREVRMSAMKEKRTKSTGEKMTEMKVRVTRLLLREEI